jgi:Fe-S-cluster containining protein
MSAPDGFLEDERKARIIISNIIKQKSNCAMCKNPWCCEMTVSLYPLEVRAILEAYPDLVTALRPKLEAQAAVERAYPLAVDYAGQHQRCAFLDDTGQCSIYDVRPVNCVLHALHVADGRGPERCGVVANNKGEGAAFVGCEKIRKDVSAGLIVVGKRHFGYELALYGGLASGVLHMQGIGDDLMYFPLNTMDGEHWKRFAAICEAEENGKR